MFFHFSMVLHLFFILFSFEMFSILIVIFGLVFVFGSYLWLYSRFSPPEWPWVAKDRKAGLRFVMGCGGHSYPLIPSSRLSEFITI